MKIPPIYELNNKHFNMNKLEHISELIEHIHIDKTIEYYFTYQINGFVYNSKFNSDHHIIWQEREKLIEEWQKFWGYDERKES